MIQFLKNHPLWISLGLFSSLLMGACDASDPVYPSYAGKYKLIAETYGGFGVNSVGSPPTLTEQFPVSVYTPNEIQVSQFPFNRSNGVNTHRLAIFELDSSKQQLVFSGSFLDSKYTEAITKEYLYFDSETAELIPGQGVVIHCVYELGARVTFTLSPETHILDFAYPYCVPTDTNRGEVCVGPNQKQSPPPLKEIGWGVKEPIQIKVSFAIYRHLSPLSEGCRDPSPSYESRYDAIYERGKEAEDIENPGDLRVRNIGATEQAILNGTSQPILRQLFKMRKDGSELPLDGTDLLSVF